MSVNAQDALHRYVADTKKRLQQLLQRLEWTEAGVLQQHHHSKEQKDAAVVALPESYMTSTAQSIQLDTARIKQLLGITQPTTPKTFDDLQSTYSSAEKLILYEYACKCMPRPLAQQQLFEENANFAELVAITKREQRKQRRYRKSKPTLREEMHQLVELQMQAMQQQRQEQLLKESQQIHRGKAQRPCSPLKEQGSRSRRCERHTEQRSRHQREEEKKRQYYTKSHSSSDSSRKHKRSRSRSLSRSSSTHRRKKHKRRSRSRSRSRRRHH